MNPSEKNENKQSEPPSQKRVIQPLNVEDVKTHLEDGITPTQSTIQTQELSPAFQPTYTPTISDANGQTTVGMSASQMGLGQPNNKKSDFNRKKFLVKGLIVVIGLSVIFAVLVLTKIIALSEFKTINYSNSNGTNFKVRFYTKHKMTVTKTGQNQLVSKVSKEGKFPLKLSIANVEVSGYNKVKSCSNFTKVFDVQNDNLNQKIFVCDMLKGKEEKAGIYIAGFTHNDQYHMVTISQDLAGVDLSSQTGAQQSLSKFGIAPYEQDIEKIVSSIKVE